MMRSLDIDQLRAFVTIATTGSFTRTGELLGRTQSAISLQIKRLESSLDCSLFDRTGRSIRLTENGERFLVEAERILDAHDNAWKRLANPVLTGHVRLGCTEEFAAVHLGNVLGSFQYAHPGVQLEIYVEPSQSLRDGVNEGRFDVVLAKVATTESSGQLIWKEDVVWVVTDSPEAEHVLNSDPLPLIASPAPCLIRRSMIEALDRINRPWTIVGTSEVNVGVQAAVMAGFGVSALPRSALRTAMRPLSPKDGLPTLPVCEVRLFENERDGNAAARSMSEFIRQRALPSGVYV